MKPNGGINSYSSKYKGVSWSKPAQCWRAYTAIKGKQIHLGYFEDEKEAAKAYDKKVLELHGEFTFLNFPRKK